MVAWRILRRGYFEIYEEKNAASGLWMLAGVCLLFYRKNRSTVLFQVFMSNVPGQGRRNVLFLMIFSVFLYSKQQPVSLIHLECRSSSSQYRAQCPDLTIWTLCRFSCSSSETALPYLREYWKELQKLMVPASLKAVMSIFFFSGFPALFYILERRRRKMRRIFLRSCFVVWMAVFK